MGAVPRSAPHTIDLERDRALTLTWANGHVARIPIPLLRRHSPSADNDMDQGLRSTGLGLGLPVLSGDVSGALRAESAELVGRYALRVVFSDGHGSGLYPWGLLWDLGELAAGRSPGIHGG